MEEDLYRIVNATLDVLVIKYMLRQHYKTDNQIKPFSSSKDFGREN